MRLQCLASPKVCCVLSSLCHVFSSLLCFFFDSYFLFYITLCTGELTLACLAPLTNIAICLQLQPDLPKMLKNCYIMGGNYEGNDIFA